MTHSSDPRRRAPAATGADLPTPAEKQDFIRQIVRQDLASGKHAAIRTRFPPEPNGYLHIGHAKAICLNFGLAAEFGGRCNLRFDDTNPAKEDPEYVDAIQDDVRWLGFEWDELRHASDYFEVFYLAAEKLIRQGDAFVCDLTRRTGARIPRHADRARPQLAVPRPQRRGEPRPVPAHARGRVRRRRAHPAREDRHGQPATSTCAIRRCTGSSRSSTRTPATPGRSTRCTTTRMRSATRSKASPIRCARWNSRTTARCTTGAWTRSTWPHSPELLAPLLAKGLPNEAAKPRQIEFSRLNINYTVMSKRKLMALVDEGLVDGWDDPRMPTLQGLRRRGYTPAAMRLLVDRVGISKQNSVIDFSVLEGCLRDDLDAHAPRRMAVIDPLKLVLTNLPEGHEETLTFANHPKDESFGTREVPFSRELWIEREDFAEVPPKGFKRLVPGGEVRLRGAGIVRCDEVVKDADGDIVELRGTLDPESRPGMAGANRKVKGTIHWVSAAHAVAAEIRLYDRLFTVADPDDESDGKTYRDHLNPDSRKTVRGYVEPAAAQATPETAFQFERIGYFVADRRDHRSDAPVFNRGVTLRDTWMQKGE